MKIRLSTGHKTGIYLGMLLLLFSAIVMLILYGFPRLAIWLSLAGGLMIIAGGLFFLYAVIRPLEGIRKSLVSLSRGIIPEFKTHGKQNDISGIEQAFSLHSSRIRDMVTYSRRLAEGELDKSFLPSGEQDEMGNVLIVLRESLLKQREETRRRQEEDEQRNWASRGIAMFNEILREAGDDITRLSNSLIKALVAYIDAEAGGLYLVEEGRMVDGVKVLKMTGSYAFDREKHLQKEILFGEGLVGRTAVEGERSYLTDLPGEYLKIRSGLGEDEPVSLLLTPITQSGEVLGVMELASFMPIPEYKIAFVCSLGENIGSIISKVYVNLHTGKLLEQSQKSMEELVAKEAELRRNLEEMCRKRDEAEKKIRELSGEVQGSNKAD